MPLAKPLDHARVFVEVVRTVGDPHLGPQLRRQRGQLLIGRMDSGVLLGCRLVDDQVSGGKPVDQGRIVRGIGAEAQRSATGPDAEGRGGNTVNRPSALDRKGAATDWLGVVEVDQVEVVEKLGVRIGGLSGAFCENSIPAASKPFQSLAETSGCISNSGSAAEVR